LFPNIMIFSKIKMLNGPHCLGAFASFYCCNNQINIIFKVL
jgi:hypothetical protein